MKRYRTQKLKDGELRVYWGKLPNDAPDMLYAWQGDSSMKRDSRLLHMFFQSQRPDPHVSPIFSKMLPSLAEELESLGYDITTFKFSILKKGGA